MIVVDASALVEWALRSAAGHVVGRHLAEHEAETHAPSFVSVEAANALRRLEARGGIDTARAQQSFGAIRSLQLVRHDPTAALPRLWALRHTLTSHDACYVALAEALRAPLVTCDARLARSHGHTASIVLAGP